jgi:hypothetical protein
MVSHLLILMHREASSGRKKGGRPGIEIPTALLNRLFVLNTLMPCAGPIRHGRNDAPMNFTVMAFTPYRGHTGMGAIFIGQVTP